MSQYPNNSLQPTTTTSTLEQPLYIDGKPYKIQRWWTPIGGVDANGAPHLLQVGAGGGLIPATGTAAGASTVNSAAYVNSFQVKATSGTLFEIAGYSSNASAQFIQLFDSATLPADTAVPMLTFAVAATSNFSFDVPITGLPFTNGLWICNSTTGPTKTIGAADTYFFAVKA